MSNRLAEKPKTMGELRDILFDELSLLRAGKIQAHRARTTAALAFNIIDSVRVELLYRSAVADEQKKLLPSK